MWHSRVMTKLPYLVVVDNADASYYKMLGRNGQTLLTSEVYKTPRGARNAAQRTGALLSLEVRTAAPKVVKPAAAV